MRVAIAASTLALVAGLGLTPLVRAYALHRGLLDRGLSTRNVHRRPTPRLGGVAIVAAFLVAIAASGVAAGAASLGTDGGVLAGLVVGGLAIAALGFFDDVRGLRAQTKFAVQLAVAALAWVAGVRIDSVVLPIVGVIELGALGPILTVLWIAGVINAMNLVDGLDGLAGGVSLVVLFSLFSISVGMGDPLVMLVAASLAGAVGGFLFFNVHPASIFMGDTGSMFIGFVLAVISIRVSQTTPGAVALLAPVLALGYPLADTLLAMVRRVARGVPMFSADRGHIHHRLLAQGLSQRQAMLVLCALSMFLCGAATIVLQGSDLQALLAIACLSCGALAGMRWLGLLEWTKLRQLAETRKHNVERLQRVTEIARLLQRAADPDALAASIAALGPALGVERVALTAGGRSWSFGCGRSADLHLVRYGVRRSETAGGVFEVGWTRRSPEADRDTEIAVERLSKHVLVALRRVLDRTGPAPQRVPSLRILPDRREVPAAVRGKRALVTGAAGMIGSEICRQFAAHGVSEIVRVDLNEKELRREARRLEKAWPDIGFASEVADVRDYEHLLRLCERYRPQLVFHAAGHKNVALAENLPGEAVKVNVFGALNVSLAAHEAGAERLVFVSTQEAVNPTSIVAATKRIAEMVIQDLSRRSATCMTSVRLDDAAEPADLSEAVRLLLLAGLGDSGTVCIVSPEAALAENVSLGNDDQKAWPRPAIRTATCPPPPMDLSRQLHELQEHAMQGALEFLVAAIQRLVPAYARSSPQPPGRTPLAAMQLRRLRTPVPGAQPSARAPVATPAPIGTAGAVTVAALGGAPEGEEAGPQRSASGAGWLHSMMTR